MRAKTILDMIEEGSLRAIASTITLTEVLVKPMQEGNTILEKRYKLLFTHFPNLTLVPININISEQGAYLRGKYNLKTPDALMLASSIVNGAKLFITNDQRFHKVKEIETLAITDHTF